MAKVSLRVYNREIDDMIEGGQFDEATAHCLHILKTFPMHIETYHLLGKSFLEGRSYTDAADIFQRILTAIPDDFVSHVGMSIVYDDKGKLDEAIWHMERAFVVQPSNQAIQGELRRLYGRRDGVEPPKIRLSRDALANMYLKGELYNQSITEIRAMLTEESERPDLLVMLMRACFFGGKKLDAIDAASHLLKRYPYCIDALRILIDALPEIGKTESVEAYRTCLRSLDPYSSYITGSIFQSNQVSDSAVNIERLEYREQSPGSQSDWAASLGIKLDDEKSRESVSEKVSSGKAIEQHPVSIELPSSQPANAPSEEKEPFQDWLITASTKKEARSDRVDIKASGEPEPKEPISQLDLPDWLKSMVPPEPIPTGKISGLSTSKSDIESERSNFLKDIEAIRDSQPESATEKTADDTLIGKSKEHLTSLDADKEPVKAEADLAWLESLVTKPDTTTEELRAKLDEQPDTSSDWVKKFADEQSIETQTSVKKEEEIIEKDSDQPFLDDTKNWLDRIADSQEGKFTGSPIILDELPTRLEESAIEPTKMNLQDEGFIDKSTDAPLQQKQMQAQNGELKFGTEMISDQTEGSISKFEDFTFKEKEYPVDKSEVVENEFAESPDQFGEPTITQKEISNDVKKPQVELEAPTSELEEISTKTDEYKVEAGEVSYLQKDTDEIVSQTVQAPIVSPLEATTKLPQNDDISITSWLKKLEESESGEQAQTQSTPENENLINESKDGLPGWLKDLGQSVASTEASAEEELPKWLQNIETHADGPQISDKSQESDFNNLHLDESVYTEAISDSDQSKVEFTSETEEIVSRLEELPSSKLDAPDTEDEIQFSDEDLNNNKVIPVPTTPEEWRPTGNLDSSTVNLGELPIEAASTGFAESKSSIKKPIGTLASVPLEDKDAEILSKAQTALENHRLNDAILEYTKLVKKGRLLEEVIHDLCEAINRFPADIIILQTLGDTYMRANRLQDALDAYTKAEELLR